MPIVTASPAPTAPRTKISTWVGRLALAIAAPLLAFAALEGALRLGGYGHSPEYFIRDDLPGHYRSNPRFTETFFSASFGLKPVNFRLLRHKVPGTLRVFVLGESAAMGVPEPGFGLAPQLRAQLQAVSPGRPIEVFNLGITAINSHVIRLIAEQAADFEPDVFVVYMGNNEVVGPYGPSSAFSDRMLPLPWIRASLWARGTRLGQLLQSLVAHLRPGGGFRDWRGMEMFAGKTVRGNDPRLTDVYRNFSANLDAILAAAHRAGARVVLSTVAVNLADCSPFTSEHRVSLSPAERKQWQDIFDRATAAAETGHAAEAESGFARAVKLDPEYADAHFRLGRELESQGDLVGAREQFLAARDWDALRFRTDSQLNEIIRAAAHAHSDFVQLVDAANAMGASSKSTGEIAGHRLFFEHVHLTWEGNAMLARLIAPAVAAGPTDRQPGSNAWLTPGDCAARIGYTPIGEIAMLMHMEGLTGRPPFIGQSSFAEDRGRLQDRIAAVRQELAAPGAIPKAIAQIEAAHGRDPQNGFLVFHDAAANLDQHNLERALALNETLPSVEPVCAEDLAQKAYLLGQLGNYAEAENVLLESVRLEPYYFQTYNLLGEFWAEHRQFTEARAFFSRAAALMPGSVVVRATYAQVLAAAGDFTEAEEQWHAVLALAPDDEAALDATTQQLTARGQPDAVLDLHLKAFAYNPRSFSNNDWLLRRYAERGDLAHTAEYMRALADSGPVAPVLHADLGSLLIQLGRRDEARIELIKASRAAEAQHDDALIGRVADLAHDAGLSLD